MSLERLAQRCALTLHAGVQKTGLLRIPCAERTFIGAYVLYKRWIEDPFEGFSRRYPDLIGDGHVFDVGANVGYTAGVFARRLRPGRRVYAFEPEADNLRRFRRYAARWLAAGQIELVGAAVGATDGEVALLRNDVHPADHRVRVGADIGPAGIGRNVVRVPLVSLDSYWGRVGDNQPVTFVKIDVQGFELPVCEGMRGLLDQNPHAAIAFEYSEADLQGLGFEPSRLIEFFRERDYRISRIDSGGRVHAWDGATAAGDYFNLLATRQPL